MTINNVVNAVIETVREVHLLAPGDPIGDDSMKEFFSSTSESPKTVFQFLYISQRTFSICVLPMVLWK